LRRCCLRLLAGPFLSTVRFCPGSTTEQDAIARGAFGHTERTVWHKGLGARWYSGARPICPGPSSRPMASRLGRAGLHPHFSRQRGSNSSCGCAEDRQVPPLRPSIPSAPGPGGPWAQAGGRGITRRREGFYTVDRRSLNPYSRLASPHSISGFPNIYDRAHGRTGSLLMVHGGCSSEGLFSRWTNAVIDEVWKIVTGGLGCGPQKAVSCSRLFPSARRPKAWPPARRASGHRFLARI